MKILKKILNKLWKSKITNQKTFNIYDRPIKLLPDDRFLMQARIVDKIHKDIKKLNGQATIAITGEWGSGKSSAMNLLKQKIKDSSKKNIIIDFEPQIEGKLEVVDIITLFYLKLQNKVKSSALKKYVKLCLKGLAASKIKLIGTIGIPGVFNVGAKFDLDESINTLIKSFDKNIPKEFYEQAIELDKLLKKSKKHLFIFIDEIDRLPQEQIINFLVFCRILELFENLTCIVGLDYEQIIWKLMHENLGVNSSDHALRYRRAKGYLDKLFQTKHMVSHDIYTLATYTFKCLKEIDKEKCLTKIINSTQNNIRDELFDLISYLSTPRQIKKWLIAIQLNYELIKNAHDNKLYLLAFLAVTVKHPIVTDYLSKNASIIAKYKGALCVYVNSQYGIKITDKDDEGIMLALLGLTYTNIHEPENLKRLNDKMGYHIIDDTIAAKHALNFLKSPTYLILMYVQGITNATDISLYSNYFDGDINSALKELTRDDVTIQYVARDLATTLYQGNIFPANAPEIGLLNHLWIKKVDPEIMYEFYNSIILYAARCIPIEIIIDNSVLGLSEELIISLIKICGIRNKNSAYDLNHFSQPDKNEITRKCFSETTFNKKHIAEFTKTEIQEILTSWLTKATNDFENLPESTFNQPTIISVLYRYIQWSLSTNNTDNTEQLGNYVISFLSDSAIDKAKKIKLSQSLHNEILKFDKNGIFAGKIDPMTTLFGTKSEKIKSLIKSMATKN